MIKFVDERINGNQYLWPAKLGARYFAFINLFHSH